MRNQNWVEMEPGLFVAQVGPVALAVRSERPAGLWGAQVITYRVGNGQTPVPAGLFDNLDDAKRGAEIKAGHLALEMLKELLD